MRTGLHANLLSYATPQRDARTAHPDDNSTLAWTMYDTKAGAAPNTQHEHALGHGAPAIDLDNLSALTRGQMRK